MYIFWIKFINNLELETGHLQGIGDPGSRVTPCWISRPSFQWLEVFNYFCIRCFVFLFCRRPCRLCSVCQGNIWVLWSLFHKRTKGYSASWSDSSAAMDWVSCRISSIWFLNFFLHGEQALHPPENTGPDPSVTSMGKPPLGKAGFLQVQRNHGHSVHFITDSFPLIDLRLVLA